MEPLYTTMEVLQCGLGSTLVSYMPFHTVLETLGSNLKTADLGASTENQYVHLWPYDVLRPSLHGERRERDSAPI